MPKTPLIGRALRDLLFQMQIISFGSLRIRRKKISKGFEFKSDTAVWTFTFRFLFFLPHEIFHEIFGQIYHFFCAFLSGLLDQIVVILE